MVINRLYMFAVCVAALCGSTSCAYIKAAEPGCERSLASMAAETLDSLYTHYSAPGSLLLRENYPFDADFRADYLADDDGRQGNPYSYLWPFSGTLSAAKALYDATGDSLYLRHINEVVLPAMAQYRDTLRTPTAYSSYINTSAPSDRFYDDNIWLGIDLAELYQSTGKPGYLDASVEIRKFIESGTDSVLGGGIYWCEQKKTSKNTCSNAPGAVHALRLCQATGDTAYLDAGRRLYEWTYNTLRDTTDNLYFDNISLRGRIGRAKFPYNSGQMIEAGALLYRLTGETKYLEQARATANAAYSHFFNGGTAEDDMGEFALVSPGCIWFVAVMMRGFDELDKVDGMHEYMDAYVRNLRHAWHTMREPETGLFNEDWSGHEVKEKKWLLTQAAMAEMYAIAAEYINRCNNNLKK